MPPTATPIGPPIGMSFTAYFELFPSGPRLAPLCITPPVTPIATPPAVTTPEIPSIGPDTPATTVPAPPMEAPAPVTTPMTAATVPAFFRSAFPG